MGIHCLESMPGDFNQRASKRTNLHSSSMASRGDVLLNITDSINTYKKDRNDRLFKARENSSSDLISVVENKPASLWDLDDRRLWLLEASRAIAQQWSKQPLKGKIPIGNINELEGNLVRHTLTLCDLLETELNSINQNGSKNIRKKVVTPRVSEMGQLEIKWQHSHKQGIHSAANIQSRSDSKSVPELEHEERCRSVKTAGQILMLKTAKKMGDAIDDN